jgi:CheY-like chemotaxis protein
MSAEVLRHWDCNVQNRAGLTARFAMRLHTPRLLITDDDRDLRSTIAGLFQSRGFDTLEAGDGEEALEIVTRQEVHLLLLDMQMPRLSGLETIRRLKQLELAQTAWRRAALPLPWILISGALDEQIVAQAREAAAFSILAKPFRLPELTGAVNSALEQAYNWRAG